MNELIKITEQDGRQVVSARELYDYFELSERFSKWFNRQLQFGFIEGIDYTPYQMVHPLNYQLIGDYALTLNCAKEISMLQRSSKGKQARSYFIACEKKLREVVSAQIPQTFSEALMLAARQAEQLELQQAELQIQAPKVIYHDKVLQSNSLISTTTIAKELGLSAQNLNKKLQEDKVIFKQNGTFVLFSKYQDKGYSGTKTTTYTDSIGSKKSNILLYWTEKGREFILNRYMA